MSESENSEKIISPIILQDVECPVCHYKEVKNYSLKSKTLPIRHNIFEVPVYDENPKYTYVDFNELQFTVCPVCFFNGANRSDFHFHGSLGEKHSTTDKKVVNYWAANYKQIKTQFNQKELSPDAFQHPRSEDAIILSVNLAIYKSTIEIHAKVPFTLIKRAHRYIRLFCLRQKYNLAADTILLKKAIEDLEEVFRLSDFPEKIYEFEVLYLIIVCSLKVGDEAKAADYIKVLDVTRAEIAQEAKTNPRAPLTDVTKWNTKAKELWQNRHDPKVWDLIQ
ncbi:hypothetical protein LPTSP4_08320 [Leptospira ryugenii]|uniref:DUF2225 domain-containing protein n=1 Tax=Leptospira ryugenii TaxID=1917863 RepID=A0A2P2DXG7_9LEPT|nr:DUF2225 domain-containing protein [Leptospira ryugenii]GBF49321.1 hypothetical protein LPTSP4_08320 [Leptospira ryugenii]